MTWDEPATRSSAGPRVVEPPKPEDRFGREDTREPDLFGSLSPAPRANRPAAATESAPPRPKSPSSVLARARADGAGESPVDLDVPTFDRRGVRPSIEPPRAERPRAAEPPRLEPEAFGHDDPALFEPTPQASRREPEPPPSPVLAAPPPPSPAVNPTARVEPPRGAPELDPFDDDADLPLHSSSSDPGALDTIAYLTNELAGDIAAFDRSDPRSRGATASDPYASSRSARTWMDTAETQLDDEPPRRPAHDLDFSAQDDPTEPAATVPAIDFGGSSNAAPVAAVLADEAPRFEADREPAWSLDPADLAGDDELDLDGPAGSPELAEIEAAEPHDAHPPRFATFLIERPTPAPAPAEPAPAEPAARAGDGARGAERAMIDWDELRAARARDWAAFDAQSSATPVVSRAPRAPEAPEPIAEPPRRAAQLREPPRVEPPRVEPRVSARDVTRDLEREVSRVAVPPAAPAVTPPPSPSRIAPPPSRWLDTEPARGARRGWNDVSEPDLLDGVEDSSSAGEESGEELAPFTGRAIAFAVDAAIVACTAVVAVLLGVIAFGAADYRAIDFVASFQVLDDAFNLLLALIGVVYFSVSHAWTGATLGKAMLGLRVVSADRRGPPSVGRSLVRSVAYVASSLLGIGFLWALRAPRRAWHDYAAGTVVVRASSDDSL